MSKTKNVIRDGLKFTVDCKIERKYPELVKLVLEADSIDNKEKQEWLDVMPRMTEEQIDRLFDILETERVKLSELEIRYQEEIRNLNEKHLIEWKEFSSKKN